MASLSPNSTNGNGRRPRRLRPTIAVFAIEHLDQLTVVVRALDTLAVSARRGLRDVLTNQIGSVRGNGRDGVTPRRPGLSE
jgi:hypothetical protein